MKIKYSGYRQRKRGNNWLTQAISQTELMFWSYAKQTPNKREKNTAEIKTP